MEVQLTLHYLGLAMEEKVIAPNTIMSRPVIPAQVTKAKAKAIQNENLGQAAFDLRRQRQRQGSQPKQQTNPAFKHLFR